MRSSEGLAALAEQAKGVETRVQEYIDEETAKREALKAQCKAEYSTAETEWNEAVAKVDNDMKS